MDTLNIVFLSLAIISIIIALIPLCIEYMRATKNLKENDISGEWYSAEFDLKQEQKANAILKVEIKRIFWLRNNIKIETKEQFDAPKKQTGWTAQGKVVATNTLSLNWEGKINNSMRYGNCFIQFTEQGGIGYWIGYASNKAWQPVYGYWILSRKKDDLEKLAKLALSKFIFVDIKELIENKTNIENTKIDCSHTWISEWKTNYDSEKEPDLVREKIQIEEKGEKILIKNIESDENCKYQALCEFYEDNYIFGTLQSSKSSISKGLISLIVSPQFDYCYGYHFGKNLNRKQEIGTWIIAKNEEALLKARKSIKDPNYHFKSDTSISDYKKMLHMYHLTKSDGKNIWKYQIIDFTKSNDEEVLIAHMEVKNKVNMTVIYQINAGQIGSHFIMIIKQITGTEEQTICIFPFMCKKTNPENCGLMFGENWDFQLQLFKVIISEKPFAEIKSQKNLSNRECKFLENKWKKGFIWKDFIYDTSQ